jgi:hypothetical protein
MEKNIGQSYKDETRVFLSDAVENAISVLASGKPEALVGMTITRVHYNPMTGAVQAIILVEPIPTGIENRRTFKGHILSFEVGPMGSGLFLDGKFIGEVS